MIFKDKTEEKNKAEAAAKAAEQQAAAPDSQAGSGEEAGAAGVDTKAGTNKADAAADDAAKAAAGAAEGQTADDSADADSTQNVADNKDEANTGKETGSKTETAETASAKNAAETAAKLEELQTSYLRLQADFDNFRKRTKTEKENLYKFALEDIMKQLLAVLDNFERALASSNDNAENFISGVEMIYKQLWGVLENNGLASIASFEQPFDPNLHNAVMSEQNENYPENTVSQELQKGYTLNGRVIRASMVKVTV